MRMEWLDDRLETVADEWVALPGGELEAPCQRARCPVCRAALREAADQGLNVRRAGPLCFDCYRIEARRRAALKAAAEVFTGSPERLQAGLPFEPVDRARLARLKGERGAARTAERAGSGRFADRRRHAQIEARRALAAIAQRLRARGATAPERAREWAAAARAAELQLPEAWLPFVVGH